jgi:hypothetical protein
MRQSEAAKSSCRYNESQEVEAPRAIAIAVESERSTTTVLWAEKSRVRGKSQVEANVVKAEPGLVVTAVEW